MNDKTHASETQAEVKMDRWEREARAMDALDRMEMRLAVFDEFNDQIDYIILEIVSSGSIDEVEQFIEDECPGMLATLMTEVDPGQVS